jgi:hypothetical protein
MSPNKNALATAENDVLGTPEDKIVDNGRLKFGFHSILSSCGTQLSTKGRLALGLDILSG